MTFYVRMTDKFMSGWGASKDRTNVLVIACDTLEQAEEIEQNARKRPEMKRVELCTSHPKARPGVFYTDCHYNDMSGSWKFGYVTPAGAR